MLVMLLAVGGVTVANAQVDSGCVTFLADSVRGAFNLATKQYSGPYANKVQFHSADWATVSPDGHYAAYKTNDTNSLWIQSLERSEPPIELHPVDKQFLPGENIRWSPNSQWLVVQWVDSGGHNGELALYDQHGQRMASYPLPYYVVETTIDGWSADGKYFALTLPIVQPENAQNPDNPDEEYFAAPMTLVFEAPQLKVLNDKTRYPIAEESCLVGYTTSLHLCLSWSGTNVAYALQNRDTNKFTLIVQQLAQGLTQQVYYKHSPADFMWSPDGKWVAVLVPESHTVDIVGLNQQIYFSAAGSVPRFCNEGCGTADMRWSPDSKSFYYIDIASINRDALITHGNVRAFRLDNHSQQIVFTFDSYNNAFLESWLDDNIVFSPDYQYVALNNIYSKIPLAQRDFNFPLEDVHNESVVINTSTFEKTVLITNPDITRQARFKWVDGKTVVAADGSTLTWWNAETKTVHKTTLTGDININAVTLSADQQWLFVATYTALYAVNVVTDETKAMLNDVHPNDIHLLPITASTVTISNQGWFLVSPTATAIDLSKIVREHEPKISNDEIAFIRISAPTANNPDLNGSLWPGSQGEILTTDVPDPTRFAMLTPATIYVFDSTGTLVSTMPNVGSMTAITVTKICPAFPEG